MSDQPSPSKTEAEKSSAVEKAKLASNYLHGAIANELANSEDHFTKEASLVLKHHGIYQQDDRDLCGARGPDGQKLGKIY